MLEHTRGSTGRFLCTIEHFIKLPSTLLGNRSFGGRGQPGLGHFFRYTRQERFTPPLRGLFVSHRLTVALSRRQYSSIQHSSAPNRRLFSAPEARHRLAPRESAGSATYQRPAAP